MTKKINILLAEDDSEDKLIISGAFDDIGLRSEIHFVDDGQQAIEFLNAIDTVAQLPSVIILDLNMPRLNGTETLKAIKDVDRYKHIPVIIFSTSVNEKEKAECMSYGATSYVVKPTRYAESLEIARYFHGFTSA